jgi:hypothetical protein
MAGLTEIEFFSMKGEKVFLPPAALHVKNQGNGP